MRQGSDIDILGSLDYLAGGADVIESMPSVRPLRPLDGDVVEFLDGVSKRLLADSRGKAYSDVATFAFWVRRASLASMGRRFDRGSVGALLGRGVVFHVAPSNVPVNFAYSLAAGLICGNANVVRVPSRDFPQVGIIVDAFEYALAEREAMRPYVAMVRYEHSKAVNDALSSIADVRVVWGGDATIASLRESPLPPRSTEVTFADRYSIAVIDSDAYLATGDKRKVALGFYNDTFLSDQNACTSPRAVVWTGGRVDEAKAMFWRELHELALRRYELQPIMSVSKLTSAQMAAVAVPGSAIEPRGDNLIVRVRVPEIGTGLMELRDSCGFFYEYACDDILDIFPLCNDSRCQTVTYLGDRRAVEPLVAAGARGIDRIVPMGQSMDFDLMWDGYDLTSALTRVVVCR